MNTHTHRAMRLSVLHRLNAEKGPRKSGRCCCFDGDEGKYKHTHAHMNMLLSHSRRFVCTYDFRRSSEKMWCEAHRRRNCVKRLKNWFALTKYDANGLYRVHTACSCMHEHAVCMHAMPKRIKTSTIVSLSQRAEAAAAVHPCSLLHALFASPLHSILFDIKMSG